MNNLSIFSDIYFLILILSLVLVFIFIYLRNKKKQLLELLNYQLFLIKIPIYSLKEKENTNLKQEISVTEQLISALGSFKRPFIFEVAVPYLGEEIHFYCAVNKNISDVLIKQIESLWPDAIVEKIEDYNIFNSQGYTLAAYVVQKERFLLPIRTYQELDLDTFLPILGSLTKINEIGEGAALQYIIKPSPGFKKEILTAINNLKKGYKLKDVLNINLLPNSISEVAEALKAKDQNKEQKEKIIDDLAVKALEMKSSKPLFAVNIRLVASASTLNQAELILNSMAEGFAQFSAPLRNELKVVKVKNPKKLIYQFSFREYDVNKSMILNTEEIASLFHLPTSATQIPKIKYLKSKESAPPAELPKEGLLLGISNYRGEQKEVRITEEDRRRHFYIIGQTGTGKSNLITFMAEQDIKAGKGLAVIDPHGDLVEHLAGLIPKERIDDVIYFDPGDINHPIGLNMLEYDFNRPEEKTFIVNELLNIFDKLYDLKQTGGPMFEQYMRNALLLLMEDAVNEPATLMEVPRVFADEDFRLEKLERIKNPVVIDFWQKEAEKAGGEAALANITPYITSKFNNFTANDYMRPIVGQIKSAFNFREIMDEGKILLVNLSKGRLGDINANLLGMIIVGKILKAALGRVDIEQEKRKDFYLYIDEFQNFTTDSISVILSEARKYRLNLIIAHQFIAQLLEKIRDSIFGNVGSMIVFRVGATDAEFLAKYFEPVFKQNDLANIDNFNAYVKLLIKGQTTKPFNIKTLPASKPNYELMQIVKDLTKAKYARSREEVEEEIYNRLRF